MKWPPGQHCRHGGARGTVNAFYCKNKNGSVIPASTWEAGGLTGDERLSLLLTSRLCLTPVFFAKGVMLFNFCLKQGSQFCQYSIIKVMDFFNVLLT